eukprot:CAMPEP_0202439290 /NCGR_PEP_ID=MMETSP1345-20130828/36081_1 /ASSEMBLY_ACC=CAM_ASM_000843 /TAXON_ID=342563 /ORGANISM="Fabrea Fabrea salina" /LENGTH=112 /DNA_ID=CAMNT_0049053813 /DNA_START=1462 /DNA_END=1797 /DNA_ORIENTATION=-
MEKSLKELVDVIDQTSKAANDIKKSAGQEGDLLSSIDTYTASLEKLLQTSDEISEELGDLEIPSELLDLLSKGFRAEDFNKNLKEQAEKDLNELKETAEAFSNLSGEVFPSN